MRRPALLSCLSVVILACSSGTSGGSTTDEDVAIGVDAQGEAGYVDVPGDLVDEDADAMTDVEPSDTAADTSDGGADAAEDTAPDAPIEDAAEDAVADAASDVPADGSDDGGIDADAVGDAGDADAADGDAATDASDASDDVVEPDSGTPRDHAVIFVGNSYTAYNSLATSYRDAARDAGGDAFTSVTTRAVTPGGYRLTQHASDAANPSSQLGRWLATGEGAELLTHLVLQEQSQIPGFPPGQADYEQSLAGAESLAARADALGAVTVLYMTWGRRTGDSINPGLYPDYPTMQDRLEAGYRAMAARIEGAGYPVEIAPVGLAFAEVYSAVAADGTDPATSGTAFWDLYSGDGSHPSAQGTWLVVQVMLGVVADLRLPAIPLVPAGVSGDRATLLRDAAWAAIEAERAR